MKSKVVMSTLAFLFTAAMAGASYAGDACCGAAAADKPGAEAAPCQHAKEGGCADCGGKCAECPHCAAGEACAEGGCAKCERCAAAAKGEKGDTCESCPGPGKCAHPESCQHACKCAEGAGAKPEGGDAK